MTPTPTLLLVVALFWTLPASVAAYVYRRQDIAFDDLRNAVHHSIERALNSIRADKARVRAEA